MNFQQLLLCLLSLLLCVGTVSGGQPGKHPRGKEDDNSSPPSQRVRLSGPRVLNQFELDLISRLTSSSGAADSVPLLIPAQVQPSPPTPEQPASSPAVDSLGGYVQQKNTDKITEPVDATQPSLVAGGEIRDTPSREDVGSSLGDQNTQHQASKPLDRSLDHSQLCYDHSSQSPSLEDSSPGSYQALQRLRQSRRDYEEAIAIRQALEESSRNNQQVLQTISQAQQDHEEAVEAIRQAQEDHDILAEVFAMGTTAQQEALLQSIQQANTGARNTSSQSNNTIFAPPTSSLTVSSQRLSSDQGATRRSTTPQTQRGYSIESPSSLGYLSGAPAFGPDGSRLPPPGVYRSSSFRTDNPRLSQGSLSEISSWNSMQQSPQDNGSYSSSTAPDNFPFEGEMGGSYSDIRELRGPASYGYPGGIPAHHTLEELDQGRQFRFGHYLRHRLPVAIPSNSTVDDVRRIMTSEINDLRNEFNEGDHAFTAEIESLRGIIEAHGTTYGVTTNSRRILAVLQSLHYQFRERLERAIVRADTRFMEKP